MLCITNACSDDVTTSGESSGKAVLKFILSSAPNINSRSINYNADSTIYDCTILTFDQDGNLSGRGYKAIDGGVSRFDMQVGLSTNRGESCRVYAVANTNNPTLFDAIQTESQFLNMMVSFATAQDFADGNITIAGTQLNTHGLLMTSEGIDVQITDGVVPFRLRLYSQSAKVKFTINAPLGDVLNGLRIKGYRLCHVPLSGYLHNKYKDVLPSQTYGAPNGTYGDYPKVNLTGDSTSVHFTYYMNENHQGEALENPASTAQERTAAHAPANATYLEVYVADMAGHSGTYRYYLGNLISGITSSQINNYNVLRGYDYYVTLNINDIDEADGRFYKGEAEVGDFLCSDGSVISPDYLASSGRTPIAIVFSTKTSVTDKAHGWNCYAMALKNVHSSGSTVGTYTWANSNSDISGIPNTSNSTWQTSSSDMDGYTNTTYLNSTDYPAGYAAMTTFASQVAAPSGTSGWFLPSNGQWYYILVNLGGMAAEPDYSYYWSGDSSSNFTSSICATALNNKISVVGAGNYDAFFSNTSSNENYWSSSEYSSSSAFLAYFYSGGNMYFASYANKSIPYRVRAVIAF